MPSNKGLKPIECGLFEATDGSIWFFHPHTQKWNATENDIGSVRFARLLRLAKRYNLKSFLFGKQRLEVW
jgi:hypothetical protein